MIDLRMDVESAARYCVRWVNEECDFRAIRIIMDELYAVLLKKSYPMLVLDNGQNSPR